MLYEFLIENRKEILDVATADARALAGVRPSSLNLEAGLPIFFEQLLHILQVESTTSRASDLASQKKSRQVAASAFDEVLLAAASKNPEDVELAKSAGILGTELLRLGYTLSHVVHIYGSICQAITGLATKKRFDIQPTEFRDLNRCLDVAIASAVTEYQSMWSTQEKKNEIERCGFFAHELRNALGAVSMAFELIKDGVVGASGNTGKILERNLVFMEELISRSLMEVKLSRSDIFLSLQKINLLLLVDQILITAVIEAKKRSQHFELKIDPELKIEVDPQFLHSALSNLIQNAIKYSRVGSRIQISASVVAEHVQIEVQDECGGLALNAEKDLFKPYEQQNRNREGLGLGLNIARRAVELHSGSLNVRNLPGEGCIFTILLPKAGKPIVNI